jgi:hypothetical protein
MKTFITAIITVFTFNLYAQYIVTSIPYTPYSYNTGTPVIVNIDDIYSNDIPLPFTFNYYGVNCDTLVIGANGLISFKLSYAGGYCDWSFVDPCPNPNLPLNAIYGVYQDIDPSYMGTVKWQTTGTYPDRMMVVSYYQIPYYGDPNSVNTMFCPSPLYATSQIVLYESTNIIEIYVKDKELCTDWNSGNGLIGIQNSTGALGIAAPGRNTSQWTAHNEAWQFTPTQYLFHVYTDNIVNADCGMNNGSINTIVSGGIPPFTFLWNSTPPQTTQNLVNVPSGYYCVFVTDSIGDTASACGLVDTVVYATPEICLVSFDTSTNHNLVIWEKPSSNGIDQYLIYKESSMAGVYTLIGTQDYSDFSSFIDTSSIPQQQPYRYKLAFLDYCGLPSLQSNYHQTIHLSAYANINGGWNLNWTDYEGFIFYTYNIYRGTSAANMTLINSVSGNVNSYTDLNPPVGTQYYMIEAVKPAACVPSLKYIDSPISNVVNTGIVVNTESYEEQNISIFPNPVTGTSTIELGDGRFESLVIYNFLGLKIKTEDISGKQKTTLSRDDLNSGTYFLKLVRADGSYRTIKMVVL